MSCSQQTPARYGTGAAHSCSPTSGTPRTSFSPTARISVNTCFRHAPTKGGRLVDPVREVITEIVASYGARPTDESPVDALIQLFVMHARDARELNLDTRRQGVATAAHLLSKSTLVSESDHDKFIERVASRMGVDASIDIRPALLLHTSLATLKSVIDRRLTPDAVVRSPIFRWKKRCESGSPASTKSWPSRGSHPAGDPFGAL